MIDLEFLSQIFRASRLSFTIIAVFAIPLMVEADFVLTMWLKNPPEYAGLFCGRFYFVFWSHVLLVVLIQLFVQQDE